MLNRLSILVFLLLSALNVNKALGQSIYSGCISGYEYGSDESQTSLVTPILLSCAKDCESNCKALFSKTTTITNLSGQKVAGEELNAPQILDCQSACQNGKTYASGFYTAQDDNTLIWNPPVTNSFYCVKKVNDEVIDSGISFIKGDVLTLQLANSINIPNKIYVCGKKIVKIRPIFQRNDSLKWMDATPPQTMWSTQNRHECLYSLSNLEYSALTNNKLWNYQSPPIGTGLSPTQIGMSGTCKWSARNPSFTNTNIWVKNGDELSIAWNGEYISQPNANTLPPIVNATRQSLFNCSKDPFIPGSTRNWCANMMIENSKLSILANSKTNSITGAAYPPLNGEAARGDVPLGGFPSEANSTDPVTWFGLTGRVLDQGTVSHVDSSRPGCNDPATSGSNPNCIVVTKLGTPQYIYQGVLKDYNTTRDALMIRHFDVASDANNWFDNYGGYNIEIAWGGCTYSKGELLQYQMATDIDSLLADKWLDVPTAAFTPEGVALDADGRIFFRIRGEDVPGGLPTEIENLYKEPGHRFGGYNVVVKKTGAAATTDGPFATLVKQITTIILGTATQKGAVQALFTAISENPIYISLMRALLVFYMVFFAIGFMIGVVPLNQNEVIKRSFKIGIIVTLTSPNAWQFIATNFLNIFIFGGLNIIGDIVTSAMPSLANKIAANPYAAFDLLDQPIKDMFSKVIWQKIGALSVNSAYGIIIALIMIFSIIMFTLALVKAILLYIFSIIGIGMLIIAMPIFIAFMLFQRTKDLFDLWWKNLVLFTVQPMMVFAALLLYYSVLKILLREALNFSICPICLLPMNIFGLVQFCLLDGWRTVFSMHLPLDAGALIFPLGIFFLALCCMMLAHNMYMFVEIVTAFSARMITMRADTALSNAAGAGIGMAYNTGTSAVSDVATAITTTVGDRQKAQVVNAILAKGRQKTAGVVGIDKDAGLRSDGANEAERMRERLMR